MEFVKTISKPISVDSLVAEKDIEEEEVLTQEPPHQQESNVVSKLQREIWKLASFSDMVAYALPVVNEVPFTCRKTVKSSKMKSERE